MPPKKEDEMTNETTCKATTMGTKTNVNDYDAMALALATYVESLPSHLRVSGELARLARNPMLLGDILTECRRGVQTARTINCRLMGSDRKSNMRAVILEGMKVLSYNSLIDATLSTN